MKKLISAILALTMLLSTGAYAKTYVRNVEHKGLATEERKLHSGKRTVIEVTNGMVVAQTYTIPEGYALQEFEAFCPSFENNVGSLTFKIYQWQGDYAKTINSKPVTTRTFTDFKDNSYLPIPCSTPVTGTVMITASDSVEKVGIWTSNTRNDKANTVYIDGVPQGDTAFEATARVYPIKGDIPETAQKKDAYTSFHLGNSDVLYNAQPLDFKVGDITYRGFTAKNNNAVGIGKVDFGSASPKGVKLLVRATHVNSDSGQMQLVLDSYATGKIIAEFNLEYRSPEHYTIEIPCEITEKITGVHDLYLTTVGSGYVPLAIEFTKEHPGKSWDEIRLEDFKATNNFELLDHHSDTWVATDMLGRKLPDISTAGKYNPDKQVGIFYLTWHAQLSRYDGYDTISNNQRVLDTYNGDPAEIINDFTYPKWGLLGYWNESVYGYYLGVDTWVHRKQLELLGAAGMDTLICDATNASQTYTGGYMALCKTMHEMHNDGNTALEVRDANSNDIFASVGAGDQGTVYGYATRETWTKLPLPVVFANEICKRLDDCMHDGTIRDIGPDGKAQVTVEYENGNPVAVNNIIVSVQHKATKDLEELRREIITEILYPLLDRYKMSKDTEILINPSGRFVKGGPSADTGLTGRKIMVDTYGGLAAHGGGAFSGKDPTKVDRSGAYMARAVARNIVGAYLADECQVAISYAIGKADPTAVEIDTFGTARVDEEIIRKAVLDVFDLRPAAIISLLHLRSPYYTETTAYGHFNGYKGTWENLDKADELRKAVDKYGESEN